MGKIGWKCVIPQCTSNTKAPGYFFPKHQEIAKKWLNIISVPELNFLSKEDIRKCKICHLHFSPDAYIFSLNRRRLKHDAVPSVNSFHQRIEDIPQPSTSAQDVNIPFDNKIQLNEENVNVIIADEEQHIETQIEKTPKSSRLSTYTRIIKEQHIDTKTQDINIISDNNIQLNEENNIIAEEEQHIETQIEETPKSFRLSTHARIIEEQHIDTKTQDVNIISDNNIQLNKENNIIAEEQHIEIEKTPKSSRLSTHARRSILGSVTRKNLLTPKARQLYDKSLTLRKRNIALQSNLVSYKKRLKYATKFLNQIFFKKYKALTNSQKIFIDMQLKNMKKKAKVCFPTFFKNLILTLKSVCGKNASVFLKNIGLVNSQSQENM